MRDTLCGDVGNLEGGGGGSSRGKGMVELQEEDGSNNLLLLSTILTVKELLSCNLQKGTPNPLIEALDTC